jgi:hypothetical protein
MAAVLPLWTEEHLRWLEARFPDRCPDPGTDPRVMDRLTGNVEVVRLVEAEIKLNKGVV